eukprot:6194182-Pleurochrysis_carterae.AAC.1
MPKGNAVLAAKDHTNGKDCGMAQRISHTCDTSWARPLSAGEQSCWTCASPRSKTHPLRHFLTSTKNVHLCLFQQRNFDRGVITIYISCDLQILQVSLGSYGTVQYSFSHYTIVYVGHDVGNGPFLRMVDQSWEW